MRNGTESSEDKMVDLGEVMARIELDSVLVLDIDNNNIHY